MANKTSASLAASLYPVYNIKSSRITIAILKNNKKLRSISQLYNLLFMLAYFTLQNV